MSSSEFSEYEIKPGSKFSLGLKELWTYRELLFFFVWRDVKVKYKQTALGVLWVVFQPLLLMLVFTFFLGPRYKTELGALPYQVFFVSGFICWNIFSSAISTAGNGMVSNASIIKKIYFPRLIIPLSSVLGSFVDFFAGILLYTGLLIYYMPPLHFSMLLMMVPALVLTFFAAFGSGTLISALNVKYRDFRYILPFFVQALMFVSPVFFVQKFDSEIIKSLFALNPMYAPIELFRTHLAGYSVNTGLIYISMASNIVLTISGIFVFRKTEKFFADLA